MVAKSFKHFLTCLVIGLVTFHSLTPDLRAQSACFKSMFDYSFSGTTQGRMAVSGDFDEDGFLDVIVGLSQTSANNLKFIKGLGNGKFAAPATFDGNARPFAIAIHDFNQDTHLDLAVTNNNISQISVLMGNGNGTFGAPTAYTGMSTPTDIQKGDFNEDGLMDLAVTSGAGGNGVYILLGSVTPGLFTSAGNFTSGGSGARGLVVADLNADNHLDLAMANQSTNNISVRLGTGTGSFGAATSYSVGGTACYWMTSGDFDLDGDIDLATSNQTSFNVSVLLNNGAGAFGAATLYSTPTTSASAAQHIKSGDFNGDGDIDLIVTNDPDNSVGLLTGAAGGTFNPISLFPAVSTPKGLAVGLFDGDANLDVVVGSEVTGTLLPTNTGIISIMLGTGTGSFTTIMPTAVGTAPQGITSADFNEDGNMDYVTANNTSNNISLVTGIGNGTFNAAVNFAATGAPTGICKGDFNGDSNEDVVICVEAGGSDDINFFAGNGTGGFAAAVAIGTVSNPVRIISTDIDVDGDLDVLVVGQGAGGQIGVMLGNGAGSFAAPTTVSTGTTPTAVTAGKINGDAIPDIAYSNFGSNNVRIHMGLGGGLFGAVASSPIVGAGPSDIASADFNGDTFLELVTANATANNISVLTNNGSGGFGVATNHPVNSFALSVTVGDFNMDGAVDIASSSDLASGSSSTGVVDVFMNSGTGTFAFFKSFSARVNPRQLSVADFTNDGMPDIVIANRATNQGTILVNTTPYITALGPTTFCGGGSVNLQSSPADTYLWSNSATTQITSASTSGNYTVTTNSSFSNWCSATSAPEVVTAASLPSVTTVSGSTTICPGTATTLTASSGASSPTFEWYDQLTGGTLLFTGAAYTTPNLVSTTTYYVQVTDGSTGCTSSPRYTVVVTVSDAIAPVISGMPSNITLNAGASCNAVATWTAPSATDNCVLISFNSNFSSGATFPLGPTTVTYTATDAASNVSQSSFTVTVNDVTNPVISGTPSNIVVNNTAGQCGANVSWAAPTASDNCSVASLICSHTIGQFFAVGGPYTITYTATDGSGNISTTNFTVTVNDTQMPTISGMPSNQTTNVAAGSCCKTVSWTAPTAADNCSISSLTTSHTSGTCFPVGTTTVTYTATDNAGNITTSSFTITVVDNINPTIMGIPSNITQNAVNGGCFRAVTWTMPTASDNCPGATIVISSGLPSGSNYPVGNNQVCFLATDAAGNTATGCFTITIVDNQLPYYTGFPANINTVCDPGQCTAVVNWTAPVNGDNCGVQSETTTHANGSTFNTGPTLVTYTLTDVNGNVHTQSFTITVVDNIAPVAVGCPGTITACQGDVVNYTTPTGTDNCPGVTVTQMAGSPSGSTYSTVGTFLHTFKIEDAAGNFVNCNFNIIVNSNPTVTLSIGDVLHCINHPVYVLNGGSPAGGVYSGTGVTGGNFNPATAGVGTHVITYTYTGTNGCDASATQNVVVEPLSCTGILDAPETAELKVYPNPNDGNFIVEIPTGYENASLAVLNSIGEVVYTTANVNGNVQVALPGVNRGMYVIRLSVGDKTPYLARVIIN